MCWARAVRQRVCAPAISLAWLATSAGRAVATSCVSSVRCSRACGNANRRPAVPAATIKTAEPAAVARHVAQGEGRFIFDVFNPTFAKLVEADGQEREDTPEQRLPDGRSFRRTARVARVRWVDQVSETELIYYVSAKAGATPERFVQAFEMRWYLHAELVHLLARAGFRVRAVYGDFSRGPLADGSPEQVVCAGLAG